MARFSVVRRMPYSPRQLFDLTADVARYPEFVPLCTEATLWDEAVDETDVRTFSAALRIVYDKFKIDETFTSEVLASPDRLLVRAVSNTGPVRHLENRWRFIGVDGGGCDVEFSLDYQLNSKPLQFVMSTMFDYAVRKMMTAFEERARQLYGPSGDKAAV